MTLESYLGIAVLIVQAVIALVWYFSKDYIKKKAENLATLEDIGRITKQVEAIKSDISRHSALKVKKYSDQYETLKEIWEKISESYLLARCLTKMIDMGITSVHPEDKNTIVQDFSKSFMDIERSIGKARPFLPAEICNSLEDFKDKTGVQFMDMTATSGKLNEISEKDKKVIQDNAKELIKLYQDCHLRIQAWLGQEDYYLYRDN